MAGPRELITSICTMDDVASNFQTIQEIVNELYTTIQEGGAGDTYKVAVDVANIGTPDYLNDQLLNQFADGDLDANPNSGVPVVADVSATKERLQVDFSQVPGYNDSELHRVFLEAEWHSGAEGGIAVKWGAAADVFDNYTVLVTGDDSTAKYLHSAFHLNVVYVENSDILVGTETVGGAGTNQKERLFVDVSAISGYNGTDFLLLGISGNVTQFFGVDDLGIDVAAGTYIDVTYSAGTWTLSVDLTEVSGYDAGLTQLLGHVTGTFQLKTIADWLKTLPGWNPSVAQIFGHTAAGEPAWQSLTSTTINKPTSIELNLNVSPATLESKLNYVPIDFLTWPAPTIGASNNFNDTVDVTSCPS